VVACGGDSSGSDFPLASIYALEWQCQGECDAPFSYADYDKMEIRDAEGDGFEAVFVGPSCAATNLTCQLDTAPCPDAGGAMVDVLTCSPLPACAAGGDPLAGLTFCRGATAAELESDALPVDGAGGQATYRLHAVVRSL
jgi:hypothetical protein